MPSDNSSKLTIPPFQSTLPPELLDGMDERGRHLYTKLNEIGQAQAWLMERKVEDTKTLDDIKTQVMKTNGRLLVAESKLADAEVPIKVVKTGIALAQNKWFWVGVAAFLFFIAPWLAVHAPSPAAFFTAVFGG